MANGKMRLRITKVADPSVFDPYLVEAMTNLGNAIGRRAQRLVPKRTWALHDTIASRTEQVRPGKVRVVVSAGGGKVRYAAAVEQGTSKSRAQPYLRPALFQSKNRDLEDERGLNPTKGARDDARRQRARDRAQDRRTAAKENRDES